MPKRDPPSPLAPAGAGAPSRVRHVAIREEEAGQRIDNFLLRILKGVPRTRVYRLLRKGEVRVNKGRIGPDYRLRAGDAVRIPPVRVEPAGTARASSRAMGLLDGRIVLEDKRLIVLDKPAGLAVHGGSGISHGVIELLRLMRPEAPFLELVHRLDRDTSGCLLVATRRSALRAVHALLRDGAVEKRYLALVLGRWELGRYTLDAPLHTAHRRGGERTVRVSDEGKQALTRFRPVEFYRDTTLMEVAPHTGRTHQIRVHAAHLGHPVAGDTRYGDAASNERLARHALGRLFLHAHALGFDWPDSGEPFHVSVPLGKDLRRVLRKLEIR